MIDEPDYAKLAKHLDEDLTSDVSMLVQSFMVAHASTVLKALRTAAKAKEAEAAHSWRCFHCDEVFTTVEAAGEHFGPNCICSPACQIDIAEYRRMEEVHARHVAEDSEMGRKFHGMRADHMRDLIAEEQKGYDKGLADGRKEAEATIVAEREACAAFIASAF